MTEREDTINRMKDSSFWLKRGIITVDEAEKLMDEAINNYVQSVEDFNDQINERIELKSVKWRELQEAVSYLKSHG